MQGIERNTMAAILVKSQGTMLVGAYRDFPIQLSKRKPHRILSRGLRNCQMKQRDIYVGFSNGTFLTGVEGRVRWPGDTISTEIFAAFSIQFGAKQIKGELSISPNPLSCCWEASSLHHHSPMPKMARRRPDRMSNSASCRI